MAPVDRKERKGWRWTYPVLVVEYDRVGLDEVEAQASRARAEQEQPRRIWRVAALLEAPDVLPAGLHVHAPVDAADRPALVLGRPVLDDVEHRGELAEQQNLVAPREQRVQQPLEHHHLPARRHQLVSEDVFASSRVFGPVE